MPLRRVDGVPQPVPLPQQHALGHAAGRHGEVPRRRRAERRHRGAQRPLPPRRDTGAAALRAQRAAGAVRRRAPCRLAHRDARDRRRRDRADARHLRRPRAAPARPGRTASSTSGCPTRAQLARAARLGVIAAPQTIFIHSLGPQLPRLPARLVPAAHLSDPRDARRRHPRGALVGCAGGRGRQPAGRDDGGGHPARPRPAISSRRRRRSPAPRRCTPTRWAARSRPGTRTIAAASKPASGPTSRCSPRTRCDHAGRRAAGDHRRHDAARRASGVRAAH